MAQPMVQWRLFVRALAEEVENLAGAEERDDMLRGVGRRLSRLMPIAAVQTLEALEMEMNDALHATGWGQVRLEVRETERSVHVVHTGMPRIGSLGMPSGQWLSAMLEGLYDGWFAQQPGSKTSLSARRMSAVPGNSVTISYQRH